MWISRPAWVLGGFREFLLFSFSLRWKCRLCPCLPVCKYRYSKHVWYFWLRAHLALGKWTSTLSVCEKSLSSHGRRDEDERQLKEISHQLHVLCWFWNWWTVFKWTYPPVFTAWGSNVQSLMKAEDFLLGPGGTGWGVRLTLTAFDCKSKVSGS